MSTANSCLSLPHRSVFLAISMSVSIVYPTNSHSLYHFILYSMQQVCSQCGSSDFAPDPESYFVCTQCGLRKDSVALESRLGTSDFQPGGNNVESAKGWKSRFGSVREANEAKVKREIGKLVGGMGLPGLCTNIALRIYTLVQEKGFVQGRKSARVMAVALYIACRMQKSPFLLVDFSDYLGLDLFQLGKYFLKILALLKLLNRQIPLVDPLFYIQRYCGKLGFEDRKLKVANTAMNIVKRMNRDWICDGRKPAGLWGAAILIAARSHGFQRSTQQILSVVKVSSDTVRKRLEEFQKLPIAALTMEEFEGKLDSSEWDVAEPPCYRHTPVGHPPLAIREEQSEAIAALCEDSVKDTCSDVDDDEINDIILSPEESTLKRILWESVNADWLEKQRLREERKLTNPAKVPVKRRAKVPMEPAKDPADALRKCGKLPKKMETSTLKCFGSKGNTAYRAKSPF